MTFPSMGDPVMPVEDQGLGDGTGRPNRRRSSMESLRACQTSAHFYFSLMFLSSGKKCYFRSRRSVFLSCKYLRAAACSRQECLHHIPFLEGELRGYQVRLIHARSDEAGPEGRASDDVVHSACTSTLLPRIPKIFTLFLEPFT